MLKRLELVGFKSFADKTQFDFPNGITAIVGPNGSGKSNIVDAVRWILGEQSAKSLRGGEMADVIFNGSATRRSFGMAEVTMTFDNTRRQLATEADDVQITRRVYRSGEGEYLINQQLCRLKDIKDLFLGSGAGNNAYSIIEQGRVDGLLQASTKDRRGIFEEAAGISRFKARKLEAARKLERVDQNLQRLRDIIDEVDKQLRSVKLQASKAQRYQEYSTRLKDLRLSLGLQEYHQLSQRLDADLEVLNRLRADLTARTSEAQSGDTEMRRLDEALARLDEAVHEQEAKLAHARQQIAAEETTLTHERGLSADLEANLTRNRARLTELNAHLAGLAEAAAAAASDCAAVESQSQEHWQRVRGLEDAVQTAIVRLNVLQRQTQTDKAEHFEKMRQVSHLQNNAISLKAQVDALRREYERFRLKGAQAAEHLATIDVELQSLTGADEELQGRLTGARQSLANQTQERERLRQTIEATTTRAGDLRAQRSGLASRIDVLDGLERTHEGLGAGVREVFALLEQSSDPNAPPAGERGPWTRDLVPGMVADFLTVRREYAPLIDLALGDTAQRFLVRDIAALNDALRQRGQSFSSRVSFLPIHAPGTESTAAGDTGFQQFGPQGVLAIQVVSCEHPELRNLPAQLLGSTRIVPDLATARTLAAETTGLRFVTLQGELLEPDGTLTVGTYHPEAGILSRKSELRELREQAVALDAQISTTERDLGDLRRRGSTLQTQLSAVQEEIDILTEQAADLRSRIDRHRQHREGLHEEVVLSQTQMNNIEQEVAGLDAAWRHARDQADEADRQVHALQQRLEQAEQEIRQKEEQRQVQQQECTEAQVTLAKVEERLTALRAKHRQIGADLAQRSQERAQGEQQVVAAQTRQQESQRTMLQASAALAEWYLQKETAERLVTQLSTERETHRQERHSLAERLQSSQSAWRQLQEDAHGRELQVSELQHRRTTLADRLREDYQLELSELYQQALAKSADSAPVVEPKEDEAPEEEAEAAVSEAPAVGPFAAVDATEANQEIDELRRKLNRLGSVNLDALQELAELENRSTTLQTQNDDLTAAQRSLQEIINKINQDSRKLFTEVFTTIRTHFQELFRKVFGGGMADIVLEDDTDILESGIEIIARPPGKELRSISLLSGGEKTMTAVALLLAIFRSKPSPFCILDEVDAALDEANIGRFTAVLREFLDRSQFILVTHSKKTMTIADVLYGITMQESGISKRVAVRFEDWPDDNNGQTNGTPPELKHDQEKGFAGR
ncbi:MAG: chromosome segregation protein SMC [Gemmataceae bacterium]|nr:chromosome segregation protein SMC [Gemmataceae bacterium]